MDVENMLNIDESPVIDIILQIIDNVCGHDASTTSSHQDANFIINEIISEILEIAYENWMLCSSQDTTITTSNGNCNNKSSIVIDIGEAEILFSTNEKLQVLSERDVTETDDGNQVIAETAVSENIESVPIIATDASELIVSETLTEISDPHVSGTNDKNIVSTAEMLPAKSEPDVSGLNDENIFTVAETLIAIFESDVSGTNDEKDLIVFETLPGMSEPHVSDENEMILSETLSQSNVNGINDKNEMIYSAMSERDVSDENKLIVFETLPVKSEPDDENKVIVSETLPGISEPNVRDQTVPVMSEHDVSDENELILSETLPAKLESNVSDENEIIVVETLPVSSEPDVSETNDENKVIVSETLPAISEPDVSDVNELILSETLSVMHEHDVSGTKYDNEVIVLPTISEPDVSETNVENIVSIAETLLATSEPHASVTNGENKVIVSELLPAMSERDVSDENEIIVSEKLPALPIGKANEETDDRNAKIVQDAMDKTSGGAVGRDDFYTDEVLRIKGYGTKCYKTIVEVTNLTVHVKDLKNCDVRCNGIPYEMTKNQLIPLLETAGQVYKFSMTNNSGCAYVTYATEQDAENAIKTLNDRRVHGRVMTVQKHYPNTRLFVKPIPSTATKKQIFDKFSTMTTGLVKVLLFNSYEDERRNRGFCYLEYESHKSALDAKRVISEKNIFGQNITCNWPDKLMTHVPQTLYISNLGTGIRAVDLRKYFSVYGEVTEIDKNGNFATVIFRNAEDSKRAAREIDKTKLGNENVEISDAHFILRNTSRPGAENQGNTTKGISGATVSVSTTRFAPRHENVEITDARLVKNTPSQGAVNQVKGISSTTVPTASTARNAPRHDYMNVKENTFRSAAYFPPNTLHTKQSSFCGVTSVRSEIAKQSIPSMASPANIERHYGPRKEAMTSNQSTLGASERGDPLKDTTATNQSSFGGNGRYGPPKSKLISQRNSLRSDAADKHGAKDTMTSNQSTFDPRTLNEKTNERVTATATNDRCGPPKVSSARNAFRQGDKYRSKQH